MYRYLFSIFTRGFLALTGILIFIVSARLFGAEGRGIISYGISIFAALGLFMSFNLGRTFLSITQKQDAVKENLLSTYLHLNLVLIFVTGVLGVIFWFFSDAAQNILLFHQVVIFSLSSAYYVWLPNGNPFFSSVSRIQVQDKIIFYIRLVMFLFLAIFAFSKINNFDSFILIYSLILSAGALIEISYLFWFYKKTHFIRSEVRSIFKNSIVPHFDYLAFNSFPLVLVVVSGIFLEKSPIGRANFVIQMINLVFMFGLVANNKLNSYVSEINLRERKKEIFRLLLFTLVVSAFVMLGIYLTITSSFFLSYFPDFEGIGMLFLLSVLAVPGYISYQFCNPLWIENHFLNKSAKYTFVVYILCLMFCPYLLSHYGETGMVGVFALFHILLMPVQFFVYRAYKKHLAARRTDSVS